MQHLLEDDDLNESQPADFIQDFNPDESLDLPAFEEAALLAL